ncbi:MAG: RNA polymerase sigma factor [Limisphaerales bacterium]
MSDLNSDSQRGSTDREPQRNACFATTRWSLVTQASHKSSPDSERALAELCRIYWYPLYAYARRRSRSREDAEDLTQSFFERFLARDDLVGLDAERGRFRAFLLASMKHFLANERDRAGRLKRGGAAEHLSWDWERADERFRVAATNSGSPDTAFDREWALALLERVITRLRDECEAEGKGALFEQAKSHLASGQTAVPQEVAARSLGMAEGAFRVAIHRLRKRYRALLRAEIAETLTDPTGVAEELQSLRAALASG